MISEILVHPDEAFLSDLPAPPKSMTEDVPIIVTGIDLRPVARENRSIARVVYTMSRKLRDAHRRRVLWKIEMESYVTSYNDLLVY